MNMTNIEAEKKKILNVDQYSEHLQVTLVELVKALMFIRISPAKAEVALKKELGSFIKVCEKEKVDINAIRIRHGGLTLPLLSLVLNVDNPSLNAATRCHVAEFLLEKGLSPNELDDRLWSPLHHMVQHVNASLVSALRAAGANMDAQTNCGWGVMHLAVGKQNEAFLLHLCQEGVNPCLKDRDGYTAKMFAMEGSLKKSKEFLEVLEVQFERHIISETVDAVMNQKSLAEPEAVKKPKKVKSL